MKSSRSKMTTRYPVVTCESDLIFFLVNSIRFSNGDAIISTTDSLNRSALGKRDRQRSRADVVFPTPEGPTKIRFDNCAGCLDRAESLEMATSFPKMASKEDGRYFSIQAC